MLPKLIFLAALRLEHHVKKNIDYLLPQEVAFKIHQVVYIQVNQQAGCCIGCSLSINAYPHFEIVFKVKDMDQSIHQQCESKAKERITNELLK